MRPFANHYSVSGYEFEKYLMEHGVDNFEDIKFNILEKLFMDYLSEKKILQKFHNGDIVDFPTLDYDTFSDDIRREIPKYNTYMYDEESGKLIETNTNSKNEVLIIPKKFLVPTNLPIDYWDELSFVDVIMTYDLNGLKMEFVEFYNYGNEKFEVYKNKKNNHYIVIKTDFEGDEKYLNKFLKDGLCHSVGREIKSNPIYDELWEKYPNVVLVNFS